MYSEQCAQVNIQVQQAPESRFNLHQSFAAETSALRLQTHLTRGSSLSHTLRLLAGKGQHTAHSLLEIEPHARHASITQQVQALKRHPQAQVQLQPFLAIHHHQVQATHGTAIGAPDAASIEYLVSHGFEEKDAINMLCRAFLHEHLPLELFHETP
jgi:Fe-S cluster assembly scaffold protein SufB